jgi:hypothetical protein
MDYNIVDDLTKLNITLPFLEVVEIPQKKENIVKVLNNEHKHDSKVYAIFMNDQLQHAPPFMRTRGKIPPFYVSLEKLELLLHNCMVDSGDTNNIMPLSIM